YGIPDFKLEKWVVDRRIALLQEEGVEFRCHANVGVNVKVSDIMRQYDAIVLCGGPTVPRDLAIPGRNLKGVYFAMEFLKQNNKRVAGKDFLAHKDIESNILTEEVLATGKNVVVIGGGDTGSDCVGTSNRHKAASVTQFELLPMPPKERTPSTPWPTYPILLKTTTSHEEGAQRYWSISTKEFIGDENGHLKALKVVDVEWSTPAPGQPARFTEVPGTEREIPCELALLAMGFVHPLHQGLLEELGVELDNRGNVKAEEGKYATNIPKVFTAGDMRRGQSLVVWAISEGRECARKVDEYLMGTSLLESKESSILMNFQ